MSKLIKAFEDIQSKAVTTLDKIEPQGVIVALGQARLSGREKEVIRLLEMGKSTKEIAATLMISVNTAKTHVRNIHRKLGRQMGGS